MQETMKTTVRTSEVQRSLTCVYVVDHGLVLDNEGFTLWGIHIPCHGIQYGNNACSLIYF